MKRIFIFLFFLTLFMQSSIAQSFSDLKLSKDEVGAHIKFFNSWSGDIVYDFGTYMKAGLGFINSHKEIAKMDYPVALDSAYNTSGHIKLNLVIDTKSPLPEYCHIIDSYVAEDDRQRYIDESLLEYIMLKYVTSFDTLRIFGLKNYSSSVYSNFYNDKYVEDQEIKEAYIKMNAFYNHMKDKAVGYVPNTFHAFLKQKTQYLFIDNLVQNTVPSAEKYPELKYEGSDWDFEISLSSTDYAACIAEKAATLGKDWITALYDKCTKEGCKSEMLACLNGTRKSIGVDIKNKETGSKTKLSFGYKDISAYFTFFDGKSKTATGGVDSKNNASPSAADEKTMAEREALAGTWKMPDNFTQLVFTNSYAKEKKAHADTKGEITFDRNGIFSIEFTVEERGNLATDLSITYLVTITGKGRYITKDNTLTLTIFANNLDYDVSYDSGILDPVQLEKLKSYTMTAMTNLKRNMEQNFFEITKRDWVWKNQKYEIDGKQLKIAGKVLKLKKKAKK